MLNRRGDMLRVLAAAPKIYENLPNMLLKSRFLLNINSYSLVLERHKRLALIDLQLQLLNSIDPGNLSHLETLCNVAISMLEKSRLIKRTIYIHDESLENILRNIVRRCLEIHRDLIEQVASNAVSSIDSDLRNRLVMLCLLAKIKFNMTTPVIKNLAQLLKSMNDVAFSWSFAAFETRDHLDSLTSELKYRLKAGTGFSVHLINTILGCFYFRNQSSTFLLHPEKKVMHQQSSFTHDMTFEQQVSLDIVKSPSFFEENEMLVVFLPTIVRTIENYFLDLYKKNIFKIAPSSFSEGIFSPNIFSKNDYRDPGWAFADITSKRHCISITDLSMFFKLCSNLNYNSITFWSAFEKVLLDLLESELFASKDLQNKAKVLTFGIIAIFTRVCSLQKVSSSQIWDLIEKVDS